MHLTWSRLNSVTCCSNRIASPRVNHCAGHVRCDAIRCVLNASDMVPFKWKNIRVSLNAWKREEDLFFLSSFVHHIERSYESMRGALRVGEKREIEGEEEEKAWGGWNLEKAWRKLCKVKFYPTSLYLKLSYFINIDLNHDFLCCGSCMRLSWGSKNDGLKFSVVVLLLNGVLVVIWN